GRAAPLQSTRPLPAVGGPRARLTFPAELPSLGYRTYLVRPFAVEHESPPASETRLENEQLLLELDPATGRIARLVLKATGDDLAAPDAKHAVVIDDPSDTWGHSITAYDAEIGEVALISPQRLQHGHLRAA